MASDLRSSVFSVDNAFPALVAAELARARELFGPLTRHLEAAGVIREEFEEYWREIKKHQADRSPAKLLKEIIQVAAMAQRAAEDLGFIGPVPFAVHVGDELERLRNCRLKRLQTSHAGATWLRFAIRRYEDAIEMGQGQHKSFMLPLLVDLAGRCQVIAEDLRYAERVREHHGDSRHGDQPSTQSEPEPAISNLQSEIPCPHCGGPLIVILARIASVSPCLRGESSPPDPT